MPKKYGWYSAQSLSITPSIWYGSPCGKYCLEVCFVNDSDVDSGTKWSDVYLVGEVGTFLGHSKPVGMTQVMNSSSIKKALNSTKSLLPQPIGLKLSVANYAEPKPDPYVIDKHTVIETFHGFSDKWFLLKDNVGIKKWVGHKGIMSAIDEVGLKDSVVVAYYDADVHFSPPGYDEEEEW